MRYRTLKVSEEEFWLICELQRLVEKKGYDALWKVSPQAAALIDDDMRFTKGRAIAVSCQFLLDRLGGVG